MFARLSTESDGAVEVVRLRALAGPRTVLLSLWDHRAEDDGWFEVEADQRLADADHEPAAAGVYYFDGPMSPAHRAAAVTANRRISAAMATHPGGVRTLVLWQPERREQVVVVLATSLESLELGQRTVSTMELLPEEDPALLPGPSRVEVYRIGADR